MSLVSFVTAPFIPDATKKAKEHQRRCECLETEIQQLLLLIEECKTDPLAAYKHTRCGMELIKLDTLTIQQLEAVRALEEQYRRDLAATRDNLWLLTH